MAAGVRKAAALVPCGSPGAGDVAASHWVETPTGLTRTLSIRAPSAVLGKLRNIGVASAVAGLVVVMVSLATAGTGLVERVHANATLVRLLLPPLLLIAIVLICAGVFRVLSGGRASWHAALAGGGVSGVILLITPTVAGYYTRWVANTAPVKLLLVLAGVLITCYIVAFGLLLGTIAVARVQLGHRLRASEPQDDMRRPSGAITRNL